VRKVKVGDRAPEFTLQSSEGVSISLSEIIGPKNIVLYFYPKDESYGCTKQACSFRDSYEVFKDLGAEIIGISSDDVQSHQSFIQRHRLPFILLSDVDNNVRKLYGVVSTFGLIPGRVTYIIDKEGIIRYIFSSQMQTQKHIDEALRILKTLK